MKKSTIIWFTPSLRKRVKLPFYKGYIVIKPINLFMRNRWFGSTIPSGQHYYFDRLSTWNHTTSDSEKMFRTQHSVIYYASTCAGLARCKN